jgi:hypothetical protein
MTFRPSLARLRSRIPSWNRIKLAWSFLKVGEPLWSQIGRAGLWPYIVGALLLSACARALALNHSESMD